MNDKILIMTHTDLDGYGSGTILFNALVGNFSRYITEQFPISYESEDHEYYKKITVVPPENMQATDFFPTDIIHLLYNYQSETKYSDILQQAVHEKRKIYILDISITEESARGIFGCLFADDVDLTWIDHHQSSVDFINSELGSQLRYKGIISTESSAALLTYNFLYQRHYIKEDFPIGNEDDNYYQNNIKNLAEDIDDHDRWIHTLDGEKVNEYFYNGQLSTKLHSICSEEWLNIMTEATTYDNMVDEGALLIKHTQSIYDRIYKSTKQDFLVRFFVIDEEPMNEEDNYLLYNHHYYVSYIATMLMATCNGVGNSALFGEDDTNHDTKDLLFRYSSCWNGGEHAWRGTFYSCNKSHVNCNKVAESFGGGGHQHAAGCTIKNLKDINSQNINIDDDNYIKFNWIINSGLSDILRHIEGCETSGEGWEKVVGNTPVLRLFVFADEADEMFGGKNFVSVADNPICGINNVAGCDVAKVIELMGHQLQDYREVIIDDIEYAIRGNCLYTNHTNDVLRSTTGEMNF